MSQEMTDSIRFTATAMRTLNRHRAEILIALMEGTMRFGELRRALGGIAQKTLADDLRILEAEGLLTRKVYAEIPPKVEYTLTSDGLALEPLLSMLSEWGARRLELRED